MKESLVHLVLYWLDDQIPSPQVQELLFSSSHLKVIFEPILPTINTGVSFPEGKVTKSLNVLTYLHLVPRKIIMHPVPP